MQVLEMEEVETLVGNANRKRLGNGGPRRKKAGFVDILYHLSNPGDTLPKLVVAACFFLLVVMYMSAQDEPKAPISAPTSSPHAPVPVITDTPDTDIVVTDDKKPTGAPTGSPVITIIDEPAQVVEDPTLEENEVVEDNHENDAFLYSRYATVQPLIDHPFPSEEAKEELADKYGKWHFWDGEEEERPMEDYAAKYPNRDIPGEEFPENAWQADAVYVNHIVNDADQLIARTMEAIFVEYGHGKPLPAEGMWLFEYIDSSIS